MCRIIVKYTSFLVLCVLFSGCAHHVPISEQSGHTLYLPEKGSGSEALFAPAFLVYETAADYNRIGRPGARLESDGSESIFVDPDEPVIYVGRYGFTTEKASYTNLVYRIHFAKVPYSLIPFNITAGQNGGIMVVVTLDDQENPLLVSTFGTCGCYLAIVPTEYLPREAWPAQRQDEDVLEVYGERLPGVLALQRGQRLLVQMRPAVHRVMGLSLMSGQRPDGSQNVSVRAARLAPVSALETLPISGTERVTSFFQEKGMCKGLVKGAVKPLESMFMSILAMDFFVGTDKAYYGTPEEGPPFYTSLKPWFRHESDIRDYGRFLRFWGWKL